MGTVTTKRCASTLQILFALFITFASGEFTKFPNIPMETAEAGVHLSTKDITYKDLSVTYGNGFVESKKSNNIYTTGRIYDLQLF